MKKSNYFKCAAILILIFVFYENSFSQKKPSLQFSVGFALPVKDLNGELVMTNDSNISFIDSNFIKNDYGVSTGVTICGALKFPLEHRGILNGILMGSYSYFNVFRQSFLGTTIENNLIVPVNFDQRFSTSTFGFGLEACALPDSKVSPFLNSNITLNILSLSVTKNNNSIASFNDAFRMGLMMNGGVELKLNSEYSVLVGTSYHLSNLFFKSHSSDIGDRLEFDRINLPINDEEGRFYSNLLNPNSYASEVNGKRKNINWWNISLGLNIILGKSGKK